MTFCTGGTEPQTGMPIYVYQTRDAIRAALGSGVLAWLLSAAVPAEPKLILISDLCAAEPPALGSFNPSWLTNPASLLTASDWLEQWYRAYIWNDYCQCSGSAGVPTSSCYPGFRSIDQSQYDSTDTTSGGPGITYYILHVTDATPFEAFLQASTGGNPSGATDALVTDVYYVWIDRGGLTPRYQTIMATDTPAHDYGTIYASKNNGWATGYLCRGTNTPPPPPEPPTRPEGVPDVPDGPDCSEASLITLCAQLADLATDLQHVFAALGGATDQRLSIQTEIDDRLTTIETDVVDNATTLDTLHTEADTIKADVELLLPLVEADVSAMLGCPPSEVTGKLLAFLPAAFAALPAGCPPATEELDSVHLETGDNSVALPAGTTAVRVDVAGIPAYWGYDGLDPKRYEPLGHLAIYDAGGEQASIPLEWSQQTVVMSDVARPTALVVNLLPPMTGTAVIMGST